MTSPHHSHPPLLLPTSIQQSATQQPEPQQSAPPVFLRCALDEYMSHMYPNYHWQPTSQEVLRMTLYAMGATDDTLLEHLARLNQQWDDIFAKAPNGRLPILGEKPQLNDWDVLYYQIPSSTLAIRIWDGNMQQYGQYCLDFFDVGQHTAVNTPNGYTIGSLPNLGQLMYGAQLVSWETAMGVEAIHEGQEKYSVQEGSRLVLTRPHADPYFFEIPCRPSAVGMVFAQPQAAIPY